MSDCIFCRIIAGEIPCAKVYEDEKILAFLDINPVNKGHTLIIPKEHYPTMVDTPDDLVGYIFIKAKELSKAVKKAVNADFVMVSVVGVDVPHFHVHLLPRFANDGYKSWETKKYESNQEMEEIAQGIVEMI